MSHAVPRTRRGRADAIALRVLAAAVALCLCPVPGGVPGAQPDADAAHAAEPSVATGTVGPMPFIGPMPPAGKADAKAKQKDRAKAKAVAKDEAKGDAQARGDGDTAEDARDDKPTDAAPAVPVEEERPAREQAAEVVMDDDEGLSLDDLDWERLVPEGCTADKVEIRDGRVTVWYSDHPTAEAADPNCHEWWLETQAYGVNQAVTDEGVFGTCTDRWWVAHWWTSEGRIIQEMEAGDIVHIDGETVLIAGTFEIPRGNSTLEGVRAAYPTEYLFQTCYDDESTMMMVHYGYAV